jgi:hypothetical protein
MRFAMAFQTVNRVLWVRNDKPVFLLIVRLWVACWV